MPLRPAQFDELAANMQPYLDGLPAVLIAIDGRDGVGKTTLGRFLAWYFNVTLIETDNFLSFDGNSYAYETRIVKKIIDDRLAIPRPVIVEGVKILHLLKSVDHKSDLLIYVANSEFDGSMALSETLDEYELCFEPKTNADFRITLAR
jgi:adenylate kinase family enzyme